MFGRRQQQPIRLPAGHHRSLIPVFLTAAVLLSGLGVRGSEPTAGKWRYQPAGRVKALVTGYCPCEKCCGRLATGSTSTGRDASKHSGVAADPKAIPYGSVVKLPGVGLREVDDTGGAMRRSWKNGIYHLDLRFKSHDEALRWGKKWMVVEIYAMR
jgi:3D (Asp-Asp-Asp) domain-containing protein